MDGYSMIPSVFGGAGCILSCRSGFFGIFQRRLRCSMRELPPPEPVSTPSSTGNISSSSNTQKSVVPAGKINTLQVTSAAVGGPIMFLFRVEF